MLIILVASVVAVFCIAGWLPGHIAKTRGHPWAQAVTVAGWVTLICGFALWPVALIWAYVDVPAPRTREPRHDRRDAQRLSRAAVRAGEASVSSPSTCSGRSSPFIVLLLLNFRAVHPDGLGRAAGAGAGGAQSVSIVPNVAGEVIDVPVEANAPLKAGDVLFRIDPVPFEAQVDAIEAQLKLSSDAPGPDDAIVRADSGRGFDVEQRQSEVDQLKAQLEGAKWNLDKTVVRAPADGYVDQPRAAQGRAGGNLPLSPVMAFIDTSETIIGVEIAQINARYIEPGQPVELTFKFVPGRVPCRQGRERAAGDRDRPGADLRRSRSTPKAIQSAPVRGARQARRSAIREALAGRQHRRLRRSSPSTSRSTHIIRKVLLRQIAILNYVNPF